MTTPQEREGRARGLVLAASLTLSSIGAYWVIFLVIFGGFDGSMLGIRITTHDPYRPLGVAAASALVYALMGGRLHVEFLSSLPLMGPLVRAAQHVARRPPLPLAFAGLLAAGMCLYGFVYGTKVAGGSDSWGYLGLSEQWLRGELTVDESFAKDVPWPDGLRTFTPLGYRETYDENSWRIVPAYSSGFPLLLAAAKKGAGEQAKFWVVPIFGGLLVLTTFGLGVRLASPAAGVIGAWLVATSPLVLQFTVVMLSDIPTAGAWGVALYFLFGNSTRSAAIAGLAAGLAVMIRPNHLPLVVALGLYYVLRLRNPDTRREVFAEGVLFSATAMCGIGATAAINAVMYGSPFRSGYGQLSSYFAIANIIPNARRYLSWLIESNTPLPLVGLVALAIPSRRLWPAASSHASVLTAALFIAALWFLYLIYNVFDAWWYLRFLLATWPVIMAATGAVLAWLLRQRSSMVRVVVMTVIICTGWYQLHLAYGYSVFQTWVQERRYISGALMVARHTSDRSVVLSMQHSGSVRYYGGRMTMRYDFVAKEWIDPAVDWLTKRGIHVYLLAEDWELPIVDSLWSETRTLQATRAAPLAVLNVAGRLSLFDLSSPRGQNDDTEYVTSVDSGLTVAGPVPPPKLTF